MARRQENGGKPRRTRDPEASQKALLDAATRNFSAKGLKGARIEEIAAAAGVNKQLVYHYFGSKDHLYLKVIERAYQDFRRGEQDLDLLQLEPVTAIRRLVAFTVTRIQEQPHFPSLVADENRQNARHVRRSRDVRRLHGKLLDTIGGILERGRREARFRDDIDALQVFIAIAGLASFYVTNARTVEAIFGSRFRKIKGQAALTRHLQDLMVRYLISAEKVPNAPR